MSKEINIRYFEVDPKDIVFIKAILESYEGMVVVRTVQVGKPFIELLIAHDFSETVHQVVTALQKLLFMVEVKEPLQEVVSDPSSP